VKAPDGLVERFSLKEPHRVAGPTRLVLH
jgi:hypothetical protein